MLKYDRRSINMCDSYYLRRCSFPNAISDFAFRLSYDSIYIYVYVMASRTWRRFAPLIYSRILLMCRGRLKTVVCSIEISESNRLLWSWGVWVLFFVATDVRWDLWSAVCMYDWLWNIICMFFFLKEKCLFFVVTHIYEKNFMISSCIYVTFTFFYDISKFEIPCLIWVVYLTFRKI